MEQLEAILRKLDIPAHGVCAYSGVLPLLPCRAAARLPERPQSVIVCLFPYYTGEYPGRNVARYAVSADYHRIAGDLLARAAAQLSAAFPGFSFVPFTDSSPIREVVAARLAGLGFVGRGGQLITPEYGSYCFIGELVTDLLLPPSSACAGQCLGCGRCLAVCPHGALGEGGALTPALCRSHITQKKGVLSQWECESLRAGGLAWGCDLCTDICPHNRSPKPTPIRAFYEDPVPILTEQNCPELCKTRAFGYRGVAVPLRNLAILRGKPAPEPQH